MSLGGIFSSAVSGLQTAQVGLRTVSDNVANVSTPGYVRKLVDQQATTTGVGGVAVGAIRRAADQFLQTASLRASADSGRAGAVSSVLDQAQTLFGDPSSDGSFFGALNGVFNGFTTLAANPTTAARSAALSSVSSFFSQASTLSEGLAGLRSQSDSKIAADVGQVNQLLGQIDALNGPIAQTRLAGGDSGDVENRQAQLIDQLSTLMDVKVSARSPAGVTLRTAGGIALAGDGAGNGAATLSYDGSGARGALAITPAGGQPQNLSTGLASGEIKGLLDLRDVELPAVQGQLAELVSQTADQLNAVHNAYSAAPAPITLTGRDTGLDLATAVGGFTGKTSVAVVDASGKLVRRVDVDFDAGTIGVGGTATAFTPASFLSGLNAALSPAGSARFADGALSLSATGSNGVAVADDATSPSAKAGRGFSTFFGLNDLVSSAGPSNYATGLRASDPSGFSGQITLRITGSDGAWIRDATVSAPAGGSMADLVASLNDPARGVGLFGAFKLDSQGALAFTANTGSGVSLSVARDATRRGADGPSVSQLFGIGDPVRASRAGGFSVRADIAASPAKLSLAKLNSTAGVGAAALSSGSTVGADALAQAGRTTVGFAPAGGLNASRQTVNDYAASIASSIARRASDADAAQTSAQAVSKEADARRSGAEGVNLDDELVKLTTYQQAYNASARLVTAAKEMTDVLLAMIN